MKFITLVLLFLIAPLCLATNDTGTIKELYIDQGGAIAIQLNEGLPNSVSANECPTYNGFAGNQTADPALTSALLAAKVSNSTVQLSILGCEAGGAWMKITAVYIK